MGERSQVASGQILGQREKQEDRLGIGRSADGAHVLVLADGMGGHAGGDVAAQLAVDIFLAGTRAAPASGKALRDALAAANAGIRDAVAANHALDGMGCTLVGALIADHELLWISVGDSPLFLVRNGQLRRLNQDHSMREVLASMVEAGRLRAADAARDPNRNALRSAVSGETIELIDAPDTALALADGDVVLLASDGIETLRPDEIVRIVARAAGGGADRISGKLLAAVSARRRKYQDNTSIVAWLHGAPPSPPRRRGATVAAAVLGLVAVLCAAAAVTWQAERSTTLSGTLPEDRHHAH